MAFAKTTISCPSCGGPVELESRFVKLAVCPYCRQTMHVTRDGVDPTGQTAELTDFASVLTLGATGTLRGAGFRTAGRLQFSYEDGVWDEWYLMFDDGSDGWLHEDEGELTLVRTLDIEGGLPAFEEIRVGGTIRVGDLAVLVTEKGSATLAGSQGQLPMFVRPGEAIAYVDGNASGRVVMIEYTADGVDVSVGEPVDVDDLEVEEMFA